MSDNHEEFGIPSDLILSFDKALCDGETDWLKLKQILSKEPKLAARITARLPNTNVLHKIAETSGDKLPTALVLAKAIFKTGHLPDVPVDELGRTPLMTAMGGLFGQLKTMRLFLDFSANPDHHDLNGQTALHLISCPVDASYLDKVQLLLSYGANPAGADKRGNTPLHYVLNKIEGVKWSLSVELRHLDRRKQRSEPDLDYDGLVEQIKTGHEAQLAVLSSVVEALTACKAGQNDRNKNEPIPLELNSKPIYQEIFPNTTVPEVNLSAPLPCPPLNNFSKAETRLASVLKNFPHENLLPPASEEDLRALAEVFEDGLPEVIAELYRHHGGMKEGKVYVSIPLKTPQEALASIKKDRLAEDNKEDYYMPNDGRKYALLWSDGGANHAGIFLKDPMAGRIFISDSVETFPVPAFRNVASFYNWLAIEHHYYSDYYAERMWDYPSMRPEDDDPADSEISKKLIAQWEDGGRTDIEPIMLALYLSPCEDNDQWTDILDSIIHNDDCDIQSGLGWYLCELLGRRRYEPAVDALYMAALYGMGNMKSSAISALKEVGNQSSRWALNEIKHRLCLTKEVHTLNSAFRDNF